MSQVCKYESCLKPAKNLGWCAGHYTQNHRGEKLRPLRPREFEHPELCIYPGCDHKYAAKGYCKAHNKQLEQNRPLAPLKKVGLNREGLERGTYHDTDGYVRYKKMVDGKLMTKRAHRVVMERILGRELLPGENVHHINGVKDDNRPENLELWSTSQPSGQRVQDKADWAIEILKLYRPEALA